MFGDVYAELKITKDLTFKTNFGIDIANVRNYNYGSSKQTTATGSGNGGNGYIKELSRITENILTYTKTGMNIVFQLQEFIHGKIMYMKTYQSVVKDSKMMKQAHGIWDWPTAKL